KIISCGEGGIATINNRKILKRARCASDGGLCVWEEAAGMGDDVFCAPSYRFNNVNAAILLEQKKRLEGILKSLRSVRGKLIKRLRLPEDCSFVESHDEAGNCGICALVRCSDVEQAKRVEAAVNQSGFGCMRPINSGRHVYSDWTVINEKRGGHHPDWDCFKHPKNQKIKTNYGRSLKQTDENLACTVMVMVPFRPAAKELSKIIRTLNLAFSSLS
ncbi:MAG: DegT/DnrJ/EryC1/StrS family aminotransferase, partial [Planctomycetota bacterium]